MNTTTRNTLLALAAGAAAGVLIDAFILEHLFFEVKRYRIGHIPGQEPPLRIIHVTDLHFRENVHIVFRKLANRINKLNPDLLLISGDSVDQMGNTEPFEKWMRLLHSDIKKVGILGNHEYKAGVDIEEMRRIYQVCNGKLLVNETEIFYLRNNRVAITGVDDLLNGEPDFSQAVQGIGHEPNHFVLIHTPKHQESIIRQMAEINAGRQPEDALNIYSFLAGHNHGGQVTLGDQHFVLPEQSGDYVQGWYNQEPPYLYLSKGFGVSAVPVRFMSRAEITLIEYYPPRQG